MRRFIKALVAVGILGQIDASLAGQLYASAGVPGAIVGWAESIDESFSIRADYATLGTVNRSGEYNGIPYQAQLKFQRIAVLADWFFWGKWRLTSGLTFNRGDLALHCQGNNSVVKVNGVPVYASQADQLDAKYQLPDVSPYIGVGFGFNGENKGWGLSMDVGVMIGRPKMTYTASPSLILKAGQSNVEQEMRSWDEQGKRVRAIPQITLGAMYSF
jgi:hypothetical protein